MKEEIVLMTDSCSSLTIEELKNRGMEYLEMSYVLDDELHSAFDEENVSLPEFYEKLDTVKTCSTGCVSESMFEEKFEEVKERLLKTNICRKNKEIFDWINELECSKRAMCMVITDGCIANVSGSFEWDWCDDK